ncbi:MAG: hypothetical protein ACKOAF_05470 [Actinomycetes bacterium]
MSTEIATAYVSLIPSFRGGKSAIAKELGSAADSAGETVGRSSGGKFSGAFGKALAFTGAVAGVGALVAGIKGFAEAGQEALAVSRTTEQIIKATGGAANLTAAQVGDLASKISMKTGVDDEAIQSASNLLLTFKQVKNAGEGQAAMFDRATAAAVDLSKAGFGDMNSSAKMLGKALNDPVKGVSALSRAGVTFTQQQKDQIAAMVEAGDTLGAQSLIMKEVESQVGGVAEATKSPLEALSTVAGNLKESIGQALLPAMNTLVSTIGPALDSLQGPLAAVAGGLGTALATAFKALAPLLPPLATALASIATVAGGVLTQAISILVPVLQPVLSVMGELATRIGPILTPILAKVGELLTAVFAAVVPLIEPLTEVILGILDAASPILGVVVDALITLVGALAPVLSSVVLLIKPLGTLIEVLLRAMMPIIQPLLPVISALAAVIGDVLTRAIGLVMTALGFYIQGWSKLAPFVLNNVAKPVVGYFLDMVSKIVDGAATAFSWVPGLGDKLKGAADAIHGFRDSATKAIGDAAKTVSAEGGKIGRGLVDQGVAMMSDPSQQAKLNKAGVGVGRSLADGMATGIIAGKSGVDKSASYVIKSAETSARVAADSHSPSLLFAAIGKDLTDGLVQGVQDGGKDVRKSLHEAFSSWFSDTVQNLKDKLKEARDAFKSFKDDVSSAISGGISFSDAAPKFDEQGKRVGGTFIEALTKQAEQAQAFAGKVKELITAGLSREALTQVLAAGVTAGTNIANELIAGGATAISTTKTLVASTQKAADDVGTLAATNWLGAGVTSAKETLRGFITEFGKDGKSRARLMSFMDSLAESMNRTATVTVTTINKVVNQAIAGSGIPGRASGGPVMANSTYWVGEKGPELLVMGNQGGQIIPNHALSSVSSSAVAAQAPVSVMLDLSIDGEPIRAIARGEIEGADSSALQLVLAGRRA